MKGVHVIDYKTFKKQGPKIRRLGSLVVSVGDIIINCTLNLYTGNGQRKHYVRMPTLKLKDGTDFKFIMWKNKEISDDFQRTVLQELRERFGIHD